MDRKPYILHPLRVMMNCESETAKICAVLHDVIEDTKITLEDLKSSEPRAGVTPKMVEIMLGTNDTESTLTASLA